MNHPRSNAAMLLVALILLAPSLAPRPGRLLADGPPVADPDPARFENAIARFEARLRDAPPRPGPILFIGSSSIRMWKLERSFPGLDAINHGFGGSHISDSVHFLPRIVVPLKPRVIVFYAGDNDVAAGKSPEAVLEDFVEFETGIRKSLPATKIVFVAIKPSLRRWNLVETMRAANTLIRERCEKSDGRLAYVDIDTPMLGADGKPRKELFIADGLHMSDAGYEIWTARVRRHLRKFGEVAVATCQFPVSANIEENARWVRRQMRHSRQAGADVAHFSECALSGYAGVDHESLSALDWDLLRRETESILKLARELELWVVLGSTHRLSEGHRPHNSLYVIDPRGEIVDRYDKRFCTNGDLRHYSAGDHFVTFDINGVRCGLLICYDIRFPELYRRYERLGVKLVFHSFYNARQKPGSIHPRIMPPTAQARAATNGMFISVNNSSAPNSWPSLFVTPDGLIEGRLELDRPGVMVHVADATRRYYDASAPFRARSIEGRLSSGKGEAADDPRSRDRTGY